jgi:hypothetical protein
MSDTVTISCSLDTTDPVVKLGFEAWIDNKKFHDTDHVAGRQQIFIEIPDDDAEHELRLIMKNKTTEHTRIDEDGNITADARLTITDMAFDEIQLGYVFTQQSMYEHDFNGTHALAQQKFYGEMGCNGTVSLKFSTPIYLWLLEHM